MSIRRTLVWTIAIILIIAILIPSIYSILGVEFGQSAAAAVLAENSPQGAVCSTLTSPTDIPGAALIHFDDLPNATIIDTAYLASDGVTFENSPNNRAIIYGNEPTEAQSAPNVASNSAVFPNTSAGDPFIIQFNADKTDVGFWIGNGEDLQLTALVTAYDVQGAIVCQVREIPIPEPHTQFIGFNDPLGRIRSIHLDYGDTTLSESIDDLYYAPAPGDDPLPTPTRTPVPTWTPMPTPTPPPGPTPTPVAPVFAAPLLPFEPVITNPILFTPDLSIHGIEITQGIQCFDTNEGLAGCPDNSLRVVNKKDTGARIYLDYSGVLVNGLNNVPVRLYIRANNVWYTADANGNARSTLDQTTTDSAEVYFNVNFTNDVVVDFYAEVDPNNTINETNESNNRWPSSGYLTLTFRRRDNLDIVSQRTRYHPTGHTGGQYAQGWAVNGGAADYFEQLLPIRDNGINHSVKSGYLDWTTTLGTGDGQHALIQTLNTLWLMENAWSFIFGTGAFTGADHVYGWVDNDGYSGGHADMPVYPHAGGLGVVGIGTDRPGTSTDDPGGGALIMVHELLHDYDLKHTDTGGDDCGSNDDSSLFPYATSSIQEVGYNPYTGKIYDPDDTHDVMSYCPAGGSKEGWIAPYTWEYMNTRLDFNAATDGVEDSPLLTGRDYENTRLGAENLQVVGGGPTLLVNVTIFNPDHPNYDPDTPAEFGEVHLLDSGLQYPVPEGAYELQLWRGQTLFFTDTFGITFESEYTPGVANHTGGPPHPYPHLGGDPPFPADPTQKADAMFIIPWAEHTNELRIVHNGELLAQQAVSLDPPVVDITAPVVPTIWPAGTTQILEWTASDPNGDPTTYSVYYSHDGGVSWQLVAAGLTEKSYDVEVDSMAGGNDVRFRVVANDGVLSSYAETSAPIEIPNKAPWVTLLDPNDGQIFTPGALVLLKGSATDLEDGSLPDEDLYWTSDRQGSLGIGPAIPLNQLDPGPHVITLTVYDSLGVPASASVNIFIGYGTYLPAIVK